MGFGFISAPEDKKTIGTVQEVITFLQKEVISIDQFEQSLLKEIRELEDLKNNFNLVESQMISIRKLVAARDETVKQIYEEKSKRNSDINIGKIKEHFQILNHIDSQLRPLVSRMLHELSKFYIEESHKVYLQAEKGRNSMHEIDEKARKMVAELQIISRNTESFDQELQKINRDISVLDAERSNRTVKKPMGFVKS